MELATTYLGLELPHPLIAGASPLGENLDTVRQLEDAGAAAIVIPSLFEEQIVQDQLATYDAITTPSDTFPEATSYFPDPPEVKLGPERYLEHITKAKEAVDIPIIGSLNGSSAGGWLDYAQQIQLAGADALELNVYFLAADPEESGDTIEARTVDMIRAVKQQISIPLAVKLSPYYSSLSNLAKQIESTGADALVAFNRFYQPDIDVEELEVTRFVTLSNSGELPLRLRWLAILSAATNMSLAVTGGVHTAVDAVKATLAGAHAIQLVSTLLQHGPRRLSMLREELADWLEEHEYDSIRQMQGAMNLAKCPDAAAYERANYMHMLKSWRG